MRLTLQVHGGIVAIQRKPVSLDTAALQPAEANAIESLVRTLVASPAVAAGEPLPDAMSYTLTVEDGGNKSVVKQRDGGITADFSRLLDQFAKYGRVASG
jgi:hypothetical protein